MYLPFAVFVWIHQPSYSCPDTIPTLANHFWYKYFCASCFSHSTIPYENLSKVPGRGLFISINGCIIFSQFHCNLFIHSPGWPFTVSISFSIASKWHDLGWASDFLAFSLFLCSVLSLLLKHNIIPFLKRKIHIYNFWQDTHRGEISDIFSINHFSALC